MKPTSDLKVIVPDPWRVIGIVFLSSYVIGCIIIIFRLFRPNEHVDETFKLAAGIGCLFTSVLIPLCLPFFMGKYPKWVVAIFGRTFLERLITDCEQLISKNRKEKGILSDPSSWQRDQRLIWIFLIGGSIVAGVVSAFS